MLKILDTFGLISAIVMIAIVLVLSISNSNLRAEIGELKGDKAIAYAANAEWETSALRLQSSLAQCQSQWSDMKSSADDALSIADAYRKENVEQRKEFQRRWNERSVNCKYALDEMQLACSESIGVY